MVDQITFRRLTEGRTKGRRSFFPKLDRRTLSQDEVAADNWLSGLSAFQLFFFSSSYLESCESMSEFTGDGGASDARVAMQEQMLRESSKTEAKKATDGEQKRRQSEADMEQAKNEMMRSINQAKADAASAEGFKERQEDYQRMNSRAAAQEQMLREKNRSAADKAMEEEKARRQNETEMELAKSEMMRNINQARAESAAAEGRSEQIEDAKKGILDMRAIDARSAAQEELLRKQNTKLVEQVFASEQMRVPSEVDPEAKAALSSIAAAAATETKRRLSLTANKPSDV
jgi:hypothetical protein